MGHFLIVRVWLTLFFFWFLKSRSESFTRCFGTPQKVILSYSLSKNVDFRVFGSLGVIPEDKPPQAENTRGVGCFFTLIHCKKKTFFLLAFLGSWTVILKTCALAVSSLWAQENSEGDCDFLKISRAEKSSLWCKVQKRPKSRIFLCCVIFRISQSHCSVVFCELLEIQDNETPPSLVRFSENLNSKKTRGFGAKFRKGQNQECSCIVSFSEMQNGRFFSKSELVFEKFLAS